MLPKGNMTYKTYSDVFWGGDLRNSAGLEALIKRNIESKKMCQELEEYLKKRSKVEADYSRSLQNLGKCFKQRDEIGVIESTLNTVKFEIEMVSQSHNDAAVFFQQESDKIKKFKEDQAVRRKALEDSLNRAQNFKVTQFDKTIQLEKLYVRKFSERDSAEQSFKEINSQQGPSKEVEKAKNKVARAEEEAEKADSSYKSAVIVLEGCRASWEKEMMATCRNIQELDEERLKFLRQELWVTVNQDSKLALDIDNSSESVREILEKCDIVSDIQAFIKTAKTGEDRPEPFTFRHYTRILADGETDSGGGEGNSNFYASVDDVGSDKEPVTSPLTSNFMVKAVLGRPKLFQKKGFPS